MSLRDPRHPARSPLTWILALLLVMAFDAVITRTSLLWGPTAFENASGVRVVFPQTYKVARKIYAPEGDPDLRVALLGNSRVELALKEHRLERSLRELRPDLDIEVSNLGIYGAFMAETEMLARHLDVLDPSLVVLTIGAPDLIRESTREPGQGPMELLRIGFRPPADGRSGLGETLDRWLRTVWPLYRFREFVREALLDRLLRRPDPGPQPLDFDSHAALFAHLYGERAGVVQAAFERWQREGGLEAYTAYLETVSPGHLARGMKRARDRTPLTRQTHGVRILDELVGRLAASGRPTILFLMPENPILALDTQGVYHRVGLSDRAAGLARDIARAHGVDFVDARSWLPADRFLDFDHAIFGLDELEDRLAREILHVLED